MLLIKLFNTLISLIIVFTSFSQEPKKDFYLKKSLKQDGFQYQFTVLEEDARGIRYFNKTKFYFWYKAQKVISTQGGASGQLLNGEFEAYHENKQLAQQGTFHKGLKDGEWTYWRKDGTLITIENWKHGEYSGTKELFNEKGELIETCKYSRFKCAKNHGDSTVIAKNRVPRSERSTHRAELSRDSKNKKKMDSEKVEKKHWLKNLFKKGDSKSDSEKPKKALRQAQRLKNK